MFSLHNNALCLPNYYLENKGIVFKAKWFVRRDITRERPFFKWNEECRNNGHARVLSGRTSQTRFKNNTFILIILKHF